MSDWPFEDYARQREGELSQAKYRAAIADPTQYTPAETRLGELLADIAHYEPNRPAFHARWLVRECKAPIRDVTAFVVALRWKGELEWVRLKKVNIYGLRSSLAESWRRAKHRKTWHDGMICNECHTRPCLPDCSIQQCPDTVGRWG